MNTYQKIANSVAAYNKQHDELRYAIRERIDIREKQIERLKKKQTKAWDNYVYWTKNLLEPLAAELQKHFPKYPHMEILGPFGIRSQCSIWLFKNTQDEIGYDDFLKNANLLSISIVPGDIGEGIFYYETGEKKNEYRTDTIGEVNGCNNVTKEIESIEELVEFLNKQIARRTINV